MIVYYKMYSQDYYFYAEGELLLYEVAANGTTMEYETVMEYEETKA